MLFFFKHRRPPYLPGPSGFGSGMLLLSLICVLFGLAILLAPALLAYFVASFLILVGISLLALWLRLRG